VSSLLLRVAGEDAKKGGLPIFGLGDGGVDGLAEFDGEVGGRVAPAFLRVRVLIFSFVIVRTCHSNT